MKLSEYVLDRKSEERLVFSKIRTTTEHRKARWSLIPNMFSRQAQAKRGDFPVSLTKGGRFYDQAQADG